MLCGLHPQPLGMATAFGCKEVREALETLLEDAKSEAAAEREVAARSAITARADQGELAAVHAAQAKHDRDEAARVAASVAAHVDDAPAVEGKRDEDEDDDEDNEDDDDNKDQDHWDKAWRHATSEEKAGSQNLVRQLRHTSSRSMLENAMAFKERTLREGAYAHAHWSAQDARHAERVVGADGWSAASIGGALDLPGVGELASVQTVCSMGCGRESVLRTDIDELRKRGALSAAHSCVTGVDIIPWSEKLVAEEPPVEFQQVRPTPFRSHWCTTPIAPLHPTCRLAGAL